VSPAVKNLAAPAAVVATVCALVIYMASCSSSKPPAPPEVPTLQKMTDHFPVPELPPPAPSATGVSNDGASDDGPSADTVEDVLSKGCSTTVVKGLSEQIIAEGNCLVPGAYAKVPDLTNVTLGKAVFPYMMTPARDALVSALEDGKSHKMKINSMLRTVAQQYLLFDWYNRKRCGIKLAAAPGKSNHQSGLAIDISEPGTWKKILLKVGFEWMGKRDRWHFDFRGAEVKKRDGLDIEAFQRLWNRNHPDEPLPTDGEWGDPTEDALRRAPAQGFPVGPTCAG
jgi:hypothetical protein